MFLSFYYFYPNLASRNINKIIQRYERLFIPYILWPFIIMIINNLILSLYKFSILDKKLLLKDFFIQLLIGTKYYTILWYHFVLIYITFLFTFISFIFKINFLLILQIISIIIIYLRYSEINLMKVKIDDQNLYFLLGTMEEMIPITATSITLSSINIGSKLKKYKYDKRIILFSITIIYFLFKYDIFIKYKGFYYPEILLNNLSANFLFIFFSSIDFGKIKNAKVLFIIKYFSKFTGGIYYLHMIIFIIIKKSNLIKKFSIFICIIIYYICYIICFLGNLLFYKTKLKFLFY